ncbi:MAG: caspase family protein, partial [Nitratireductor sp.]
MRRCVKALGMIAAATMFLPVAMATAAERVALIIGNNAYENMAALNNPVGDATRLATTLTNNGFEVMSCDGATPGCFDLDRGALQDALEDFEYMADGASVALVFYAGHGMQTAEGNVLAPTDMELSCGTWKARREVLLDDVLEAMEGADQKIVILDACRNDPFKAQQCVDRGARPLSFDSFAVPDSASRFLLITSTRAGQLAQDGVPGAHSPFAEALFHWMENEPTAPFAQMLDRVSKRVIERTT